MDSARWLLESRLNDVRELDLAGFRAWLERRVARWRGDPAFAQRARIRNLRRSYPGLLAAEKEHQRAVVADRAAPFFDRFCQLEAQLEGLDKAVDGLAAAGRVEKLAVFQARREEVREELTRMASSSVERLWRLETRARLDELRDKSGLGEEESTLQALLRRSGQGSGRRGRAFEQAALEHARGELAPRLGADRILTGVTLGAVDTEFDLLLVRTTAERAVVLAAVEAKRNINDLAHGYRLRRRNLKWLAGGGKPQPTAYYRSGHFDRPFPHEGLLFDQLSFRQVELHLFTRPGWIWGLGSATLSRLNHRACSDVAFRWQDSYLRRLHQWTLAMTASVETPDLLRKPNLNLTLLQT